MSITRQRRLKSLEPSALDYIRLNYTHSELGTVRNEGSQMRYAQGRPGFMAEDTGVRLMKFVSYHQQDAEYGDYIMCQLPGTTAPADRVEVAVEPQLQSILTSQTNPDGLTWSFDYPEDSESKQKRTSTNGDTVLTEYITPPFVTSPVPSWIPVIPCTNTGVYVQDVETEVYEPVNLLALGGRHWASG